MKLYKLICTFLLFGMVIRFCLLSFATDDINSNNILNTNKEPLEFSPEIINEQEQEQTDETVEEQRELTPDEILEQKTGMKIYSESAVLLEEITGKVLYDKNSHDRKYPASTTKILTAIIALEECDLDEKAKASYEAVMSLESGYTKADIQVGEEFTIEELLDVMMLQSANEAANIIAEHISGSVEQFAELMNKKAREIGCKDSNFVNPNGMHNENHYSTAYDLALIARYCMKNEYFRKLVVKKECSLPHTEYWSDEQVEEHGERKFVNTNNLLIPDNKYYYPYATGIKSGFTTPAKNCLISSSNKDGFEVISVILHAESTEDSQSARYVDTINLFEYGYNNYNLSDILKEYNLKEDTKLELVNTTNVKKKENNKSIQVNNEKIVSSDNNMKSEIDIANLNSEKIKNVISREFAKIIIGIVLIIVAVILILFKGKRGKHEYQNDLYKFRLDSKSK